MPIKIDLAGKRFGRLLVLSESGYLGVDLAWNCQCSCGTAVRVRGSSLRRRQTKSCGCLQPEAVSAANTKHGMSGSRASACFVSMMHRCHTVGYAGYESYGGRGIQVCDRWRDNFPQFYNDMGDPPEGMTLERRKNHEGYSPSNCKWATSKEQAQNRRTTRLITHGGVTMSISEWCRRLGIPRGTAATRERRGVSIKQALGLIGE